MLVNINCSMIQFAEIAPAQLFILRSGRYVTKRRLSHARLGDGSVKRGGKAWGPRLSFRPPWAYWFYTSRTESTVSLCQAVLPSSHLLRQPARSSFGRSGSVPSAMLSFRSTHQ